MMIGFDGIKGKELFFSKWFSVIILMAIILCGCHLQPVDLKNEKTGMVRPVIYPEGFDYDDHVKLQALKNENMLDDDFLAALDGFAYRTASPLLNNVADNANYSPLSLYFAFSLVTAGAKGDTAEEMLSLLGVSDVEALSVQCGKLYRLLYRDNDIGKLTIANSLWMDNEVLGVPIKFKERFIENAVNNYYASLYNVDFSSPAAARAMSEWIAANTGGKILPAFAPNPRQVLSIINTIYFYDSWVESFDEIVTVSDKFYAADDREVMADYMNKIIEISSFSRGVGFTRSGLNMKNGNEMVFILPDEGISPSEILSSPEKIKAAFTDGQTGMGKVRWALPKYSFSSSYNLVDLLKEIGVNLAFTEKADFSGITEHPICISAVQQDTYIAIDESGVEAAAYTKIDLVDVTSVGPQLEQIDMILNRPFIYGIKAPNGSLLFIGVVNNPAQ